MSDARSPDSCEAPGAAAHEGDHVTTKGRSQLDRAAHSKIAKRVQLYRDNSPAQIAADFGISTSHVRRLFLEHINGTNWPMPLRDVECQVCGKAFKASHVTRAKYCGTRCRHKAFRINRDTFMRNALPTVVPTVWACADCGYRGDVPSHICREPM
jgi:hypothetical protein